MFAVTKTLKRKISPQPVDADIARKKVKETFDERKLGMPHAQLDALQPIEKHCVLSPLTHTETIKMTTWSWPPSCRNRDESDRTGYGCGEDNCESPKGSTLNLVFGKSSCQ
ncbi:hypothetical protein ACN47E_000729 [Coniothyrium glycines]